MVLQNFIDLSKDLINHNTFNLRSFPKKNVSTGGEKRQNKK